MVLKLHILGLVSVRIFVECALTFQESESPPPSSCPEITSTNFVPFPSYILLSIFELINGSVAVVWVVGNLH